ncbi:hypothetical protein CEK62_10525 [Alcanivorax sp. N3-2A]|nr:hypothetical protein CEK62_10525 [Alcanivorax sp. N3-2A]
MSGITPILDTLLHQVLGKRVDIPPPRELNPPVQPLSPGDALQALGRDAGADAQAARLKPALPAPATPATPAEGAAPAPANATESGSTRTRFSPAARAIADILARFPAPPGALRPTAPLVPEGTSPAPSALAGRLQASVDQSGLFYEAHLGRWFRGELTLQQLAREPQMLLARPLAPGPWVATPAESPMGPAPASAPVASAGGASGHAPLTARPAMTPSAPLGEAAVPLADGAPTARPGEPERGQENRALPVAAPAGAGVDEPVHETLHGLLRHQLELLTTPVLRWEGDVWAGLFMALVIQPPAARHGDASGKGGERDGEGGEDGEAQAWQSELRLHSDDLGEIRVRLHLASKQLSLVMNVDSEAVARTLREGGEGFSERLHALGFDQVRLNVEAPGDER